MFVRAVLGDVREHLGAGLGIAVRLRELHHRAVGLARHQERLLPFRIAQVDVHGIKEAGTTDPRQRVGGLGTL